MPLRKLTLGESCGLLILAGVIGRDVDATLGKLVERVACGDDSALLPAADRLIERGRPDLAERMKKLTGLA